MDTNKQFKVTGEKKTVSALDYDVLKTQLRIELTEQVNGFVRIGYLLKQARDTDILVGSEYKDVMDFASKEFHLTKDVVSRYINICEKYSEGGNSDRLLSEYTEYGYSKLSEMLTLPDEIAAEIPPEATRREIQEIKRDYQKEQEITPLEVLAEEQMVIPAAEGQKEPETLLEKTLYMIGKDDLAFFQDMHEVSHEEDPEKIEKKVLEAMAPNGFASFRPRIPQIGRVMMTVQDNVITITNMRTGEKESHLPSKVLTAFRGLLFEGSLSVEEQYDRLYPKVAPVQPEENEEFKNEAIERQRDDTQKAAGEKKPEPRINTLREGGFERKDGEKIETGSSQCKIAGSKAIMNEPEEVEKVEISPEETEIVEKETQNTNDVNAETSINTLWEGDFDVDEIEEITKALLKTKCFHNGEDSYMAGVMDEMTEKMASLIWHIRQWKWEVAESCANKVAMAAGRMKEIEKEKYDRSED